MPKKRTWSPLKNADNDILALGVAINECNGGDVAINAASSFGNIEAAYYVHEIDNDKMVEMKSKVSDMIYTFRQKCKCMPK